MNLQSLKIVTDENIPAAEQLFSGFGEVVRRPGRQLSASDVADADLLLVRSITPVNEALLRGSKVRFVGTATIGTDHVDQSYLNKNGISFASAPGCNADAVTEYVLSVLSLLAGEQGFRLQDKTLGIIGVGNVGSRLQSRLEKIGVKLLLNDPPRQQQEGGNFCDLPTLLQQADIICMHTPLIKDGNHPSKHLLNEHNLPLIKQSAILLNAGRGPVIDNQALLAWHQQRNDVTLVLDVWEHEPVVDSALAERVRIGTPHIAGYSLDGKIRGTFMLYQAFCVSIGIEPQLTLEQCLPQHDMPVLELKGCVDPAVAIHQVYDSRKDDARFRDSLIDEAEQPIQFDLLRKHYPVRREFAAVRLKGVAAGSEMSTQLKALGFNPDSL